jgi:methyl-accepting chemotaxis protein
MKSFRTASVGTKVALAPAIAVLLLVVVTFLGVFSIRSLTTSLESIRVETLVRLAKAADMNARVLSAYALTNQALAWQGAEYPPERIAALDKAVADELKDIGDELAAMSRDGSPSSRERVPTLLAAFSAFANASLTALDMKSTGLGSATPFIDQAQATYQPVRKALAMLATTERASAEGAVNSVVAQARHVIVGIVLGPVLAIALSAFAAWRAIRRIVSPLQRAKATAEKVAEGDLRVRTGASESDETGDVSRALDLVAQQLGSIVADVRIAASEVALATDQLAHGNIDLAMRTEHQAARVQQSASSIEQLTAVVNQNARSAESAATLASEVRSVGEDGSAAALRVKDKMSTLSAHSRRIAEIAGMIDGIAFQTNILSLNAAVEAARAGDQGRGFSVVASEVRALSMKVGEAAKEIRTLIDVSVKETEEAERLAIDTSTTVSSLGEAVFRVNEMVQAIAQANRQQAIDIDAINSGVVEMDRSTQQNAALVEQATAATASLHQQSMGLTKLLERFSV